MPDNETPAANPSAGEKKIKDAFAKMADKIAENPFVAAAAVVGAANGERIAARAEEALGVATEAVMASVDEFTHQFRPIYDERERHLREARNFLILWLGLLLVVGVVGDVARQTLEGSMRDYVVHAMRVPAIAAFLWGAVRIGRMLAVVHIALYWAVTTMDVVLSPFRFVVRELRNRFRAEGAIAVDAAGRTTILDTQKIEKVTTTIELHVAMLVLLLPAVTAALPSARILVGVVLILMLLSVVLVLALIKGWALEAGYVWALRGVLVLVVGLAILAIGSLFWPKVFGSTVGLITGIGNYVVAFLGGPLAFLEIQGAWAKWISKILTTVFVLTLGVYLFKLRGQLFRFTPLSREAAAVRRTILERNMLRDLEWTGDPVLPADAPVAARIVRYEPRVPLRQRLGRLPLILLLVLAAVGVSIAWMPAKAWYAGHVAATAATKKDDAATAQPPKEEKKDAAPATADTTSATPERKKKIRTVLASAGGSGRSCAEILRSAPDSLEAVPCRIAASRRANPLPGDPSEWSTEE